MVEVLDGGELVKSLCVQVRISSLIASYRSIHWQPVSGADRQPLMYSEIEKPAMSTCLLQFKDPLIQDSTHEHAFYFPDQQACRLAAEMIGLNPDTCAE